MYYYHFNQLAAFFRQRMADEGFDSERAFVQHYRLPRMTLRRLLAGQRVEVESLIQVAERLDVPPAVFFRLCGYLPDEEHRSHLLAEVEALLGGLPEEAQRRLRDLVR
jgi:hypothetical protein